MFLDGVSEFKLFVLGSDVKDLCLVFKSWPSQTLSVRVLSSLKERHNLSDIEGGERVLFLQLFDIGIMSIVMKGKREKLLKLANPKCVRKSSLVLFEPKIELRQYCLCNNVITVLTGLREFRSILLPSVTITLYFC